MHFRKELASSVAVREVVDEPEEKEDTDESKKIYTWSPLLPMFSRIRVSKGKGTVDGDDDEFSQNRFLDIISSRSTRHTVSNRDKEIACWSRITQFAWSLANTTLTKRLESTKCVVGIDVDDAIFGTDEAKKRDASRPRVSSSTSRL